MGRRHGGREILLAVVAAAILIPCVLAMDYVVGDENGWTINFDYNAWAQGKLFFVGDSLIFNYEQGRHNVFKVNGTTFKGCTPPADVQPMTSGNDRIQLKTSGRKWYICGIGFHCTVGQRLAITVLDQGAAVPSPSPLPTPPPPGLPTNSTNAPPPAPSATTKAAVSGFVMAFTVLAGIL